MLKLDPHFRVVIAAIIWSTTGLFVKYVNLPPTTISFFRLGIPTVLLFVLFRIRKTPLFKKDNKLLLSASTVNAIRMFFFFVGYTYASIRALLLLTMFGMTVTLQAATIGASARAFM